jgi:hypothetical protein
VTKDFPRLKISSQPDASWALALIQVAVSEISLVFVSGGSSSFVFSYQRPSVASAAPYYLNFLCFLYCQIVVNCCRENPI